ncbi:AMP-binding protein [Vulgatibacter sp.]|uniref:AMP-binding protein n=1 Tax=Vulgatibacter sp. TaxID=1971226 RepID=UPI003565250C
MIPARLEGRALPPQRHRTVQEALRAAAGSDTGLTFWDAAERETVIPWREVHRRACHVAGALARLGVRPGDRVAMILPTSPAFPDAFFGTLLAGAVPVPLYPPLRLGRLGEYHERTARMLRACGAVLLLSDRRIRRLLGEATALARPPLGCVAVEDLELGGALDLPGREAELAVIQFSSGTTVDPKPVALRHENVLANVAAIDSYLPEEGPVRQAGVSWLPLYHDMGLIGCLLLAVAHPGPLTLIPPELFLARPALWLRAVAKKRATVSPAPNFAFGLCLRRVRDEDLRGLDLSSWRLALNGAEPIAAGVLRRFAERFAPFGFDPSALLPVYGLSEASLAVTFSRPGGGFATAERDGREVVSVGVPVPGTAVEVRGEDGAVLPLGEVGRIHVRSPSVMAGYFERPDATAEALQGGWLDTGDLGFVQGGELFVSGRAKDVIVLRGANHAPQAFEECLDAVEGVRTGCAVAVGFVPDGGEGEELALLVEVSGPSSGLGERVRAAVLEATGIRAHAVVELSPGTLPRTSSGKLRRGEARRQWLAGELLPPAPVTPLRLASAVVRSQLAFVRSRFRA